MALAKFSVNHPIATLMVFLAIILLGFISWVQLPQELFPPITYPQITVVTAYENAAPEEIESLITKIIEEAVGTVNNVKRISSVSKEGLSLVMVEFSWGTNMDFAALNVREKIDLIKERLPRESQEPIVMKYNPFDLPVMNLAITGPLSALELRELSRKYIKDAIEKVEGVASATISGGDEREILVEIDQARLRASQVSIVSIVDTLKATNINYPAGTIKQTFLEYLIRTMGEYQKIGEIQDTPTALELPEDDTKTQQEKEKQEKLKSRRLVYLKDIGRVKDSIKEKTSISRYNGKESVSITVRKQSGTNSLNVVIGIKKEIRKLLTEKIPRGVKIEVTYDQSKFIQEALGSVRDAGIQGGILAFIVLFIFLWEISSALIITSAIPICITATIILMYFTNINLNMMSLGGLAMGVGMVVDNANVVIENIFRYRQQEKKPLKEAIVLGTEEMVSPIIGSTLTSIAVFLPFAFVVGIAGQIFKQLSFTITFSLLASIVVAISLVPVLMAFSREQSRRLPGYFIAEKINEVILRDEKTHSHEISFGKFVVFMLERKFKVIGVVLLLFLLSLLVLFTTEKQFLPKVDQRQFIIKVDLAPGTRLEVTDSVVKKIEKLLLGVPDTKGVTVNIGSSEQKASAEETVVQTMGAHQAQIMVNLKQRSRKLNAIHSTDEIIQYLKNSLGKREMEGATIEYIAQETSFGTALEQGAPIAIEIKGPDLSNLVDIASEFQAQIKKIPGVYGTKSSMSAPSPETKLNILKDKASLYGLSVRDIAITSQVALKGYVATKFKEKQSQEDVDIRVRLRQEDRNDLGNLRRLLIRSPLGMDISMSDVAYLTHGSGPTEIKRVDQQRSVVITANTYQRKLGQIISDVERISRNLKYKLSKDYSITLTGEQQRMQESFKSLAFALIFAFTLVYMIMAGEFESLWQPFLIMFTVPLSLIGVAFSLFITRTPLSVVAYLGIIMLGGIAVNNGIVLIELVNQLRKEGYSPYEAVLKASKTRLRPILMTSLTTILGLLPLALGMGEGAGLQAPLALTVMGGLTSSTFLTLVFIPALYLIVVEHFGWEQTVIETKPQPQEETPLPEPLFKEEPSPKQEIPPAPIAQPIAQAQLPAIVPKTTAQPETILNPRQKEVLEKLKTIKRITRKEYAQLFKVSVPTAARDLKELVDKGLLAPQGPLGPGRWYEIKEVKA
ncbi:MAG: efflux RND transporter permease subunit [Candidatus Omnitrophota bacterium]